MNDFIKKITEIDTNLFLFLNKFHNPFFDNVMWHISAKYTWIPLYLFIFFIIFRKFKFKKGSIILIATVFLIFLSDQTSVFLFKFIFLRPRPCFNPNISDIVHVLTLPGGKYGFISSHASNSFALAVFVFLVFKKRVFGTVMLLWALSVSYSRIYLGVHYPADIFFGALWGISLSFLVFYLIKDLVYEKHSTFS